MDVSSVCVKRDFHNLIVNPRCMHFLDEPHGYVAALVKNSLAHQMCFSAKMLEDELLAAGTPHVLQIKLQGDDLREPSAWTLFADGEDVASGSGAFARECFYEGARVFLDVCRDAVRAASLPEWSEREYRLLSAARKIAAV